MRWDALALIMRCLLDCYEKSSRFRAIQLLICRKLENF